MTKIRTHTEHAPEHNRAEEFQRKLEPAVKAAEIHAKEIHREEEEALSGTDADEEHVGSHAAHREDSGRGENHGTGGIPATGERIRRHS